MAKFRRRRSSGVGRRRRALSRKARKFVPSFLRLHHKHRSKASRALRGKKKSKATKLAMLILGRRRSHRTKHGKTMSKKAKKRAMKGKRKKSKSKVTKRVKRVHPLLWFAKKMAKRAKSFTPGSRKARELTHKAKVAKARYAKMSNSKRKLASWKKRVLPTDNGSEKGWLGITKPKEEAVEFLQVEETAACAGLAGCKTKRTAASNIAKATTVKFKKCDKLNAALAAQMAANAKLE